MRPVIVSLLAVAALPRVVVAQARAASPCLVQTAALPASPGIRSTAIHQLSPQVVMLFTYSRVGTTAEIGPVVLVHRRGGWPTDTGTTRPEAPLIPPTPEIPGHHHSHPAAKLEGMVVQFGIGEQCVWVDRQEIALGDSNVVGVEWPEAEGRPAAIVVRGSVPAQVACSTATCSDVGDAILRALATSPAAQPLLRQ